MSPATVEAPAPPVVLVDDHLALAYGLAASLERAGCPPVAIVAPDQPDLLDAITAAGPELVLLDLDLGPGVGDATELAAGLCAAGIRVVMLTGCTEEATLGACLAAGASDVLSKALPFDQLLDAVIRAVGGGSVSSEAERHRLLAADGARRQLLEANRAPFRDLTQREAVVLGRLIEGLGPEEIAARELVSLATIRSQLRAIYRKLGVHTQVAAVAMSVKAQWSPP